MTQAVFAEQRLGAAAVFDFQYLVAAAAVIEGGSGGGARARRRRTAMGDRGPTDAEILANEIRLLRQGEDERDLIRAVLLALLTA